MSNGRRRCWLDLPEGALDTLDARATPGFDGDDEEAAREADALRARLDELQTRLYAEGRQRLLVLFQAMDTGGKDGAITKAFSGVDPHGLRVVSFKKPTSAELARDFLWRVHREVPASGEIVVFNRSHYEDVLIVRVHGLVPEKTWRARYAQIREFEHLLASTGTTIVKIYLHIDRDEQKSRLLDRLNEPGKHWKFNPQDVAERRHWDDYMGAYRDAIAQTHARHAPWYIVPANRKWYRNWAVLRIVVDTLERMDPRYPQPDFDPASIRID